MSSSSTAFLIAAGVLVPGSRLLLEDVGVNWTRTGFLRILRRMKGIVLGDLEDETGELDPDEPVSDLDVAHGALEGTVVEPDEVPLAIDELPLEFHRALEHVAIVISDGGRRRRAYGLYQGDTVARDFFHDRIVIFRDTLLRDFSHDPELLKAQVTRTVRHELAHHLGWNEKGVHGLGL